MFISLGYNCCPRIFIKNKYNLSKEIGYKTCPFDLCITNFYSLLDTLDYNFKNFFEDLKVIPWGNADGIRDLAGIGKTAITNKSKIIFNHEGGSHSHLFKEGRNDDNFYIRNNFKEFKKRYNNRINNFKNYLSENDKITFIYKINDSFNKEKIENIIKKHYKNIKQINFLKID